MLTVPQISVLKNMNSRNPAFSAHLFEALESIRKAINTGFSQIGIDPRPSATTQAQAGQTGAQRTLPPPSAPQALHLSTLTAGIIQYVIVPAADVNPGVSYYLQTASDADFSQNVSTVNLGHGPVGTLAPGSGQTIYVRCWTQLKNSLPSPMVPGGVVTTM